MSTKQSNSAEEIRNEFQKLFEKSPEEQVEHRAQLLSYIFLSEAQKAMDRKGWTRKQLADEIGTSASYLTQLFRGDRLLNFKTVAKIERALETRFDINATESESSSKNYPDNQDLEWKQTQLNEPD
jgi:ribosome-binding protein aMBF1 (putative translation factor)